MAEEPKPPFVRFEMRPIEDREASIKAGHYVGNDVCFAIVTPVGTRDTIERKVEDWLENIREGVRQERIPAFWASEYERAYRAYQESREAPESGTSVRDWPVLSKAQVNILLDINVRTVEQLAEANEETLGRVGMGARALKEKAKSWLKAGESQGKVAQKINALETENAELKAQNENLTKRLQEVEIALEALKKVDA